MCARLCRVFASQELVQCVKYSKCKCIMGQLKCLPLGLNDEPGMRQVELVYYNYTLSLSVPKWSMFWTVTGDIL